MALFMRRVFWILFVFFFSGPRAQAGHALCQKKILLVDDNNDDLFFAQLALEKLGCKQVSTAGSAKDGFKILEVSADGEPISLVISDFHMVGDDGIQFLQQVRSDVRFHDLPFVILSDDRESESKYDKVALGLKAWLSKGTRPHELEDRFLNLLQSLGLLNGVCEASLEAK